MITVLEQSHTGLPISNSLRDAFVRRASNFDDAATATYVEDILYEAAGKDWMSARTAQEQLRVGEIAAHLLAMLPAVIPEHKPLTDTRALLFRYVAEAWLVSAGQAEERFGAVLWLSAFGKDEAEARRLQIEGALDTIRVQSQQAAMKKAGRILAALVYHDADLLQTRVVGRWIGHRASFDELVLIGTLLKSIPDGLSVGVRGGMSALLEEAVTEIAAMAVAMCNLHFSFSNEPRRREVKSKNLVTFTWKIHPMSASVQEMRDYVRRDLEAYREDVLRWRKEMSKEGNGPVRFVVELVVSSETLGTETISDTLTVE